MYGCLKSGAKRQYLVSWSSLNLCSVYVLCDCVLYDIQRLECGINIKLRPMATLYYAATFGNTCFPSII